MDRQTKILQGRGRLPLNLLGIVSIVSERCRWRHYPNPWKKVSTQTKDRPISNLDSSLVKIAIVSETVVV